MQPSKKTIVVTINAKSMKRKLIFLISVALLVASCAEECEVSTGKTVNIDMSTVPLSGEFKGKYKDVHVNIANDSTAVVTFKDNNYTYEIIYKIDTIGQYYETYNQKYID
jgi:hypothetical protein